MQLVLISGLSGSGKSIALNALEDSGYYCVDNLPGQLLQQSAELLRGAGHNHVAMSIDARMGEIGYRLDTTDLLPNMLRNWLKEWLDIRAETTMLLFESFSYKHGVPLDADLVFDVRCLPNPHYDPRLRPLTGLDAEVVALLEREPKVGTMLGDIRRFVETWLPAYGQDSRSSLTVAVGCTGGRHRSVYLVERLGAYFRGHTPVLVRHRHLVPAA